MNVITIPILIAASMPRATSTTIAAPGRFDRAGVLDHAASRQPVAVGPHTASGTPSRPERARDLSRPHLLKGMECEYAPAYRAYFEDELLGRLELDYLVGAAHFIPHDGDWLGVYRGITDAATLRAYAAAYVALIEWKLFAFIAHPDLFANSYLAWDRHAEACSREILRAAEAYGVPLEINGYGFRKPRVDTSEGRRPMYPWIRFWELAAEYDIEVVLNSDAHRPEDVAANLDDAAAIAARFGLRIADLSLEPNGSNGDWHRPAVNAPGGARRCGCMQPEAFRVGKVVFGLGIEAVRRLPRRSRNTGRAASTQSRTPETSKLSSLTGVDKHRARRGQDVREVKRHLRGSLPYSVAIAGM